MFKSGAMGGDLDRRFEATAIRKGGDDFPVELSISHFRWCNSHHGIGIVRDITEQRQIETELKIAATAFESQIGMTIINSERKILRVNKAFSDITGYTPDEVIGQNPRMLSSGRHDNAFYSAMFASLDKTGSWQGEIWNRNKSGRIYPEWLSITAVKNKYDATTHYVAAFSDISSQKAAEHQITNLAFYDPLTELPNRRLLMDRLEQALTAGARHKQTGALLFVDLDNFKNINDTVGHHIGDILLQQAAQRLITCVRDGDTVARLGGDEFVVMLDKLGSNLHDAVSQAEIIGCKLVAALQAPYVLDGRECRATSSIGIAMFTDQRDSIDEIMKRADLAMYQSKAAGRNTLRFFDPQMQAEVDAKAALESDLRTALAQQQFFLYYQAQVTRSGDIIGAEVLLRWLHPQRGMVSPAEFIPMAEQTGLILPLGAWVLKTACAQIAEWSTDAGLSHLTLAVNVSAVQFQEADFVDHVLAILDRTGANPQRLKLELTESILINNVDDVITKMGTLKSKGVGFSLDDFGTGYSSLSYLSRLPLDQIKIDQSFVRDIETSDNAVAICAATIGLAYSLKLKVVAEGVETKAQQYFLSAVHRCDLMQGYLFSRPIPLKEFEQLVAASAVVRASSCHTYAEIHPTVTTVKISASGRKAPKPPI